MPGLLWRKPDTDSVFLTFDDGPIPELTPWVIETLGQFGVQATFFCVGDNIRKHPDVFALIAQNGHTAANHTYHHLKGWKVSKDQYLSNVALCEKLLNQPKRKLFRPPYGRITRSQATALSGEYQIVMWDVLTCDYSQTLREKDCLSASLRYTRSGSIVVFHDNLKASRNLKYTLPRYLERLCNRGICFERL